MSAYADAASQTWRAILADRAAITTLFGSVILYSFFYPAPYHRQVAVDQPVVVVDHDRSAASRALVRSALAVRAVRVVGSVTSLPEAQSMVERDDARAILLIDRGFERGLLRGTQPHIELLANGTRLSHAGTALAGLGDAVAGFTRARFASASPPPFQLIQRPLFNTREGYASAVVPAVSVLIVHQTLLLTIVLLIATRREAGDLTWSVPTLLGGMSVFVAVGSLNLLYYNGLVMWFQDYPRGGNTAGMLVATVIFIIATVAFATFLGSFFRVRERALQVIGITSLPLFFLANTTWPKTATPVALTKLALALPTTSGINAMVKLDQMGATVRETSSELATLALLAVGYGTLAAWRYRRMHGLRDAQGS